jgi:hypothetical protein
MFKFGVQDTLAPVQVARQAEPARDDTVNGSVSSGRERTIRDPTGDVSKRESTIFLAAFSLVLGGILAALITFVAWSNVWGNYGDEGFFYTYNDRRGKSEALVSATRTELPRAWLMGGSTIYPLLPDAVEERFGISTYTTANFWVRMDENWSWLNFILDDFGAKPELIILGLETWTFRPDNLGPVIYPHLRRRLINAPLLMSHLDDSAGWKVTLSKGLDLLSSQQLRLAAIAVRTGIDRQRFRPAGEDSLVQYFPDGSGPYKEEKPKEFFADAEINNFYKKLLDGEIRPGAPETVAQRARLVEDARFVTTQEIEGFFPGRDFDPAEVELLERFSELAAKHGIPVIYVLMPVHPYFEDILIARTNHVKQRRQLQELVARVAERSGNDSLVVDATNLRSFGGDPMAWHDPLHMKPSNGDKILDLALRRWTER